MDRPVLSGNIPPLLTPLNDDESIDELSLSRLIDHLLAGGVDGIFMFGSSGEGPLLDLPASRQALEVAIEAIGRRVPLLVGVSQPSVRRVRENMEAFNLPGVDAFVTTLPFYGTFDRAEWQLRFFQDLAQASPRPLVIYNIPQAVHAAVDPETIARLASHPNIVALKDSYGDMARFHRILTLTRGSGLTVFQGAEFVYAASLFLGANGLVSGMANLVPAWIGEMIAAAKDGDWERVRQVQERLTALGQLHFHGHWLACLKMAAHLLGLCGPRASSPIGVLDAAGTEQVRRVLQSCGLL